MGGNSANKNQPTSQEDSPSSRSFLSRLSFLSRSRTRNLADFHIRAAEPHRKYSAGDHVKGAVVLTVLKPIRITHLTVTLHGFVKVYKGPNNAHDVPTNPALIQPGSGTPGRTKYFGNGHASLFQDEQVLSADGRLDAGRYEFNFELVFPSKGLPSSIDFERGTISYMITATLTRPTAIAPTTTCDRKIYLVEQVDIGSLTPPRARTISIEPISRRSKRKRPPLPEKSSAMISDAQETGPSDFDLLPRAPESVTGGSMAAVDDVDHESQSHSYQGNPRSPTRIDVIDVVSEISTESAISGSTGVGGNRVSDPTTSSSSASQIGVGTGSGAGPGTKTPTADEKTITASIELLKGGCLPGDFVPIKVSVQHVKRIKSVHGVIVTLFRQGRIDSAPPISLFTDLSKEEIRKLEKEEYFPKSKTGLSGLSLSSAGSCSVFRKDLSQAFGPLIIDPVALDASLTISIRVPEDVFPTIKGVPGELISFKYQLEVLVDLGGKLASQIQSGQSKSGGGMGLSAGIGAAASMRDLYENGAGLLGHWGGSIIDTDQLRRQKGVISVVFEIPVGTLDTSRQRTRGSLRPNPSDESQRSIQQPEQPGVSVYSDSRDEKHHHHRDPEAEPEQGCSNAEDPRYPYMSDEYTPTPHYDAHEPLPPHFRTSLLPSQLAPVYIPPPTVSDEADLSDKERIRRAEQRLLPSRPPDALISGPSSPHPRDEEDLYNAEEHRSNGPSSSTHRHHHHQDPSPPTFSAERMGVPVDTEPTAPTMEDLESRPMGQHHHQYHLDHQHQQAAVGEDKLERERRRLLAEASAPPDFPDDYDGGAGSGDGGPGPSSPRRSRTVTHQGEFEPTAPILPEDEDHRGDRYDGHVGYSYNAGNHVRLRSGSLANRGAQTAPLARSMTAPVEPLPKYER